MSMLPFRFHWIWSHACIYILLGCCSFHHWVWLLLVLVPKVWRFKCCTSCGISLLAPKLALLLSVCSQVSLLVWLGRDEIIIWFEDTCTLVDCFLLQLLSPWYLWSTESRQTWSCFTFNNALKSMTTIFVPCFTLHWVALLGELLLLTWSVRCRINVWGKLLIWSVWVAFFLSWSLQCCCLLMMWAYTLRWYALMRPTLCWWIRIWRWRPLRVTMSWW